MKITLQFLILFLTLACLNELSAQRRFEAGVVLGANISQVDGDDLGGYHRIGLTAGGRVDTKFTERWRLSFELLFSQMGSARSKFDYPSFYDKIRLNYIEVPVSVKFRDWMTEGINEDYYRLEFSAGLAFGRLINFKVINLNGAEVSETLDYKDNMLFVQLGAAYMVNEHFGIHAHWAKSLIDLDNDPGEYLLSRLITFKGFYLF